MTGAEIEAFLAGMIVLVDTREQPTPQAERRYRAFGCPVERRKLDFGDYSALFRSGGQEVSLEGVVTIERKYSLDELAMCYTRDRKRFTAEFERARTASAKVYLLIEGGSWEKAYGGQYRSQMDPKALVASMTAWLARYNCQLLMCEPGTSGFLIAEVLKREGKEFLSKIVDKA